MLLLLRNSSTPCNSNTMLPSSIVTVPTNPLHNSNKRTLLTLTDDKINAFVTAKTQPHRHSCSELYKEGVIAVSKYLIHEPASAPTDFPRHFRTFWDGKRRKKRPLHNQNNKQDSEHKQQKR
jgi:hypothetical protein